IAQSRFSRMHAFKQRNWPRPRADRTMRVTDVLRQRLVFTNLVANAFGATRGSGSRGWQRELRPLWLAPFSFDELAIIAVSEVVASNVIPEKASRGVVYIGFANFQRIFVGYRALIVIYSFFATISDLPGFFVVVAGNCRGRPIVPIARDLAAVIEVVEHTELQSELVFVGGDVRAVHSERWVAVADFQVAEDLIIGAIFLDHVYDVADGIGSGLELDFSRIAMEKIALFHLAS